MEMRKLDERGKQCPMPVIEAKQALAEAAPGEMIEVIVDNEIAVQNLTKMAKHKQLKSVNGNFLLLLKLEQRSRFQSPYRKRNRR